MEPSQTCIDLIKRSEALRLQAYLDDVGVATIGYGHTPGVKLGDDITEHQADALLAYDVAEAWRGVRALVTVPMTQGICDALTDFAFNLGAHKLAGSTLLRLLNSGDYAGAREQLMRWVYGGGKVLGGLVKRRQAEYDLWRALQSGPNVPNT